MRTFCTAVAVSLLLVGAGAAQAQAIIYVDDDAPLGGNGDTWPTAYRFLQDARAEAALTTPPVEIRVAGGTYEPDRNDANPNGTGNRSATFNLLNSVSLLGSFAGLGAPDPDQRDLQLHPAILSGDLAGDDAGFLNNAENSFHVVTGDGTDGTAVLDGFVITAGNADIAFANSGAGLINDAGSPLVSNCSFAGNSADDIAGAMNNGPGSNPQVIGCSFTGNVAGVSGGAMFNFANSPTITDCTFESNAAQFGGAIVNSSAANATISNCTFCCNTSQTLGGAIENFASSPTIADCRFSANVVMLFDGGAISNREGSSPTISNCLLQGNSATLGLGGAMSNFASDPVVTGCTLANNAATAGAGGVHSAGGSSTVLANCIVWGNPGGALGGPDAAVVTYSDIQGGWPGAGNSDADPLFIDSAGGDFRLRPSSPCVDAGDNAAVPADALDVDGDGNTAEPVPFDLDGNLRFLDGTTVADSGNGTGAIVDMGAYENQLVALNPEEFVAAGASNRVDTGDLDGDGDVDVVIGIPGDGKSPGSVQVFRNVGLDAVDDWQGLLANPEVSAGLPPSAVAVGDLDADNHLDVAVTNAGDDSVTLLFNDGAGNGTFLPAVTIPNVGGAPSDVAVADFTGDGFLDLAVTNRLDHQVRILVNDGAGSFAFGEVVGTGGLNPLAIDPSDLDNDKDPDLAGLNGSGVAASGAGPGKVFVLLNNRGLFGSAATYAVGVNPTDLAIGDVDLDGFADIVAVNGADATASVLVNQGGGTFAAGPVLAIGNGPLSVEAVDLDGDLDLDLAVVADVPELGRAVQVLINSTSKGQATFADAVAFDLDAQPNYVVSADFDGNYFSDLVTVNDDDNDTGGSVTVLLNRPPCPTDANLDGQVGILDFLLVLGEWGACQGCQCQWDVDQDCDTDVEDFLLVLGGWGSCP